MLERNTRKSVIKNLFPDEELIDHVRILFVLLDVVKYLILQSRDEINNAWLVIQMR